nr:MAG TPA: hypothetical protein [Caudoviricetes sp.]
MLNDDILSKYSVLYSPGREQLANFVTELCKMLELQTSSVIRRLDKGVILNHLL